MAALDVVLATMLSTSRATLFRGIVYSVANGQASVVINGGLVDRVAYPRGLVLAVNDPVFLISQEDFGLAIFMVPETVTPPTPLPAQVSTLVEPSALADWQVNQDFPAGRWVVSAGTLHQTAELASSAVWFYDEADFAALTNSQLSRVEIQLERTSGDYIELKLHSSVTPTGGFFPDDDVNRPTRIPEVNTPTWVPLPLAWGTALINGTAHGLTARSANHSAVLDAGGLLRFTSL